MDRKEPMVREFMTAVQNVTGREPSISYFDSIGDFSQHLSLSVFSVNGLGNALQPDLYCGTGHGQIQTDIPLGTAHEQPSQPSGSTPALLAKKSGRSSTCGSTPLRSTHAK